MASSCPFEWLPSIGVAAWCTDSSGLLSYANARARTLLGLADIADGKKPCHLLIRGVDEQGTAHCVDYCKTRCLARAGEVLLPLVLRCGVSDAHKRWLRIIPIAVRMHREQVPSIIHCAVDAEQLRRLKLHVSRVASVSIPEGQHPRTFLLGRLTKREREILSLLERASDPHRIAYELHVSYTTIRNHIQHILSKLDAHSIQEAVALYLLEDRG